MKVYFYGNCQVTALKMIMLEDHESWSVKSLDVSSQPINDATIKQHFLDAAEADVVVCQPVREYAGVADASTALLRSTLPASTDMILIPSMFFDGTLPSFTYLPQRMAGWNMPYHDSHTIEMILRGYALEDITVLLSSPDLYTAEFVEAGIAAGLTELRRREARDSISVPASPVIDEYSRSISMMNTINHPNRFFLAQMLNGLYRALSLPQVAAEDGHDHLREPYLPPLPSVAAHLKLSAVPMDVEAAGQRWTRAAYLRQSFAYYTRIPPGTLLGAFTEAPGYRFIKSYRGVAGVMGEIAVLPTAAHEAVDVENLVASAFNALLRRNASAAELVEHCKAVKRMGVQPWLAHVAVAEEFVAVHAGAEGAPRRSPA